jgi:2-desacetyl-2-hydroxyethyl bacteriochlorophyllide A dehydrogenase
MTAVPSTMRAAVYRGPLDVAIEERPVPTLGPHDVLLEVSHCGICGSDLHFVIEGWGTPGSIEGHEYSGRVAAIGDAVTRWRVGDEVVGGPGLRCGTCEYCVAGRPSLCTGRNSFSDDDAAADVHDDGAFAEFTLLHEDRLVPVPAGITLRQAALAEPLAVALHGLTQGGVQAGQRVLVTGCGPIGALSTAAALARGVREVVVSEPHPRRRELAERLGATAIMPDELHEPDFPSKTVADAFDVVLECSGHSAAMEAGLGQLKRAGTLVLVGAGMRRPKFDNNRILMNELVITGAFVYDDDGFDRALELLASPDFPTDALIEPDDVPLDDLVEAIQGLHEGDLAAKVMIVPRGNRP